MYAVFLNQTVRERLCLSQMEYRLQSIYNHMVGWAGSNLSPLFSILLEENRCFPRFKKKFQTKNRECKNVLVSLQKTHFNITIINNLVGNIKLLTLVTSEYSCTESLQNLRCNLL